MTDYNTSRLRHREWMQREQERRKEEMYLERIATLMDTNRQKLDVSAKIKLWEDGPNYEKVVKYVNNSQCHPDVKLTVVNIHRVWRHSGRKRILDSNRKLLWHGTKRSNIPAILENGFRLPPSSNTLMFGCGVYFADRITKSSNYSDQDKTFLLLCEVGLGRVYSCARSHNDLIAPPAGFNSVKGNGTYVPDWLDNGKYLGMQIPFGKTAKCTKYDDHAVLYNEFIVYDPNRIIIRFLVEVKVEKVYGPTSLVLVVPRTNIGIQRKNNQNKTYASSSGVLMQSQYPKTMSSTYNYNPAIYSYNYQPTPYVLASTTQPNPPAPVRRYPVYIASPAPYILTPSNSGCAIL